MRQRAVVLETDGKEAVIEVSRATMCDGCEKHGGCEGHCEITGLLSTGGKMKTRALNRIGASVGDTVEVETESGRVLGYAALVFILPIIMCGVFYFAADALFEAEFAPVVGALIGFVLTFAGIAVFDRAKRKKEPDIVIVDLVSSKND